MMSIRSGRGPEKGVEGKYGITIPLDIVDKSLSTDTDLSGVFKVFLEEIRDEKT